jgi:hypothetical protein
MAAFAVDANTSQARAANAMDFTGRARVAQLLGIAAEAASSDARGFEGLSTTSSVVL